MAEFSMDKMARSVAERVMEILKDNGVFDEDIISRKHLLSEIDNLMQSPWFNNGKDYDGETFMHYGYVERKEAVEIVRDLCVKAEPSVTSKPRTGKWIYQYDEFGEWDGVTWHFRCSECGREISLSANEMSSYNNGKDLGFLLEHYPYCHCGTKMEGEQND